MYTRLRSPRRQALGPLMPGLHHRAIMTHPIIKDLVPTERLAAQLLKLIKCFVKGKCHPAMTSLVHFQQRASTLSVSQSRTALGKRRPSVAADILSNQHLIISTDAEEGLILIPV